MSDRAGMPASYDADISREPDNSESTLAHARQIGAEHGRNAASWVFDGNTDGETYRRVLAGIEAGDPAILDSFDDRIPCIGGAGDYDQEDLAGELGFDGWPALSETDAAMLDSAADAYGEAAGDAFWTEVERAARMHVQAHGLDMGAVYTVAGSGVAWHVVTADAVDGKVTAVMVGDDREESVDVTDLTAIDPDSYCSGCGQIGCEGDFRHA